MNYFFKFAKKIKFNNYFKLKKLTVILAFDLVLPIPKIKSE